MCLAFFWHFFNLIWHFFLIFNLATLCACYGDSLKQDALTVGFGAVEVQTTTACFAANPHLSMFCFNDIAQTFSLSISLIIDRGRKPRLQCVVNCTVTVTLSGIFKTHGCDASLNALSVSGCIGQVLILRVVLRIHALLSWYTVLLQSISICSCSRPNIEFQRFESFFMGILTQNVFLNGHFNLWRTMDWPSAHVLTKYNRIPSWCGMQQGMSKIKHF